MELEDNDYSKKVIIPLSVLTGLSCWIPMIFLDDLVSGYFRNQIVSRISANRGYVLSKKEINELSGLNEPGCVVGCLSFILITPLKFLLQLILKIFRKFFFFLEIKRSIDLTSRVLVYSFLLDWLLREKRWDTNILTASALSKMIHGSCSEIGTKPMEKIISSAYSHGKTALLKGVELMQGSIARLVKKIKREEPEIDAMETLEQKELEGIIVDIALSVADMQEEYWHQLKNSLVEKLEQAKAGKVS